MSRTSRTSRWTFGDRWSLVTWRRDRRSLRRALPTLCLLTALFTTAAGVAAGAAGTIRRDVLESGGLTHIELSSFEGESSVRPLTTKALTDIARVSAVREVVPDYSGSVHAEDPDQSWDLTSHTLTPADGLPVTAGRLPTRLGPRDVVVPARAQGTDFTGLIGHDVPFGYSRATGPGIGTGALITLRVVATYDPAWQVDGPGVAYLSPDTAALIAGARSLKSLKEYRATEGAQSAIVVVRSQKEVAGVARTLQERGFSASPVADRVRNLPGFFGLADLLMRAGVVILALVAVGLGIVRAGDSARARLGDFAVLRVLGAGRAQLGRLLLGEAALTGATAGGTGLLAGTGVSLALAKPLGDWLGLPIRLGDAVPGGPWIALALLLPVLGLCLGTLFGGRELLRNDPYLTARAHS